MSRMKTFFIYFLIFIGFYIVSSLLIDAYIKTSYYKISSYEINVDKASVTIMSAKASKDDGHIEGKIYNNTEENITDKYMKVELFSDNNISLGKEYVKIDELNPKDIKDFKINFTCDNVKNFKITLITPEEKAKEDEEKNKPLIQLNENKEVEKITNQLKPGLNH